MASEKRKHVEHVPETATLDCPQCNAVVAAPVLGHYSFLQDGPDAPIRYLFAKCPSCNAPMVAAQENYGDWSNDYDFEEPVRVLPARPRLGVGVPKTVATAFEEAGRCYGARAYAAATIMCRKALEAVVAEYKVSAPNLAAGLEKLREDGRIEQRLFEWADVLRLTGNDAAHDVSASVSQVDAKDTLDFTAALVEYTFTFRVRFEEFMTRRSSKKSTT